MQADDRVNQPSADDDRVNQPPTGEWGQVEQFIWPPAPAPAAGSDWLQSADAVNPDLRSPPLTPFIAPPLVNPWTWGPTIGKTVGPPVILGRGTFGTVFEVDDSTQSSGKAADKITYETTTQRIGIDRYGLMEIANLLTLSHPNIINILTQGFTASGTIAFRMPLLSISLNEMIRQHWFVNYQLMTDAIAQIITGVEYLHMRKMIHRDLKPSNILYDANTATYRIIDFGSSKPLYCVPNYIFDPTVSTQWYRAPEMFMGSVSYGPGVDSWAMGCIFYEIISGVPLFPSPVNALAPPEGLALVPEIRSIEQQYAVAKYLTNSELAARRRPTTDDRDHMNFVFYALGSEQAADLFGQYPFWPYYADLLHPRPAQVFPRVVDPIFRAIVIGLLSLDARTRWSAGQARALLIHTRSPEISCLDVVRERSYLYEPLPTNIVGDVLHGRRWLYFNCIAQKLQNNIYFYACDLLHHLLANGHDITPLNIRAAEVACLWVASMYYDQNIYPRALTALLSVISPNPQIPIITQLTRAIIGTIEFELVRPTVLDFYAIRGLAYGLTIEDYQLGIKLLVYISFTSIYDLLSIEQVIVLLLLIQLRATGRPTNTLEIDIITEEVYNTFMGELAKSAANNSLVADNIIIPQLLLDFDWRSLYAQLSSLVGQ